MIDAKELRIGNYFEWSPFASMGIGIDRINNGEQIDQYSQLKNPIPLTPEILEQCGFAFRENIAHWANCDDDLSYWFIELPSGKKIEVHLDNSCNFLEWPNELKYLHQLQNLYFALTGEELQVNIHDKTQTI